jgi:DNA-binding NarL/FixJ family response regulator
MQDGRDSTELTKHVLIVARASRFRDGLRAVVQALSWVEQVDVAAEWTAVSKYLTTHQPALVILDAADLSSASGVDIGIMRTACSETKCLVMIDRAQQRTVAQAVGADAILLRGFSTELLYQTMETMLQMRSDKILDMVQKNDTPLYNL